MRVFSEKVNYGLSAIFELAKSYNKGYVQIKQIATSQKIPKNYLEQLLIDLKRAGIVESMRGSQGGYRLKKLASDIKILDLIEALESPIEVVDYSKNSVVLQDFWKSIEKNLKICLMSL
ncbi:MAG TPA: Rrf2 family transcriptional regulator [archaeon]|nr:Rrf2 family transcriptional regulator [archaeon]